MRDVEIEALRAVVAAGQRTCAIDGCPLGAVAVVSVELSEGETASLPACWYHDDTITGEESSDVHQEPCPGCGAGTLVPFINTVLTGPRRQEFEVDEHCYRCPACGEEWHEDRLWDQHRARRNARYAQQVAEADGAGQPPRSGTRGGDDER